MTAAGRASPSARTVALRASLVWHDEVMDDVVLEKPSAITVGATGKATFVVPELGLPAKFAIIKPGNRGYLLTLGENMRGTICVDGKQQEVAEFLRNAGDRDSRGGFRATPISGRDWGVIDLDHSGVYKLFFQFVPLEDAQPFVTVPVVLAAIGGYLLSIAVLAALFLWKGVPSRGVWAIDVPGMRLFDGYHWELFDSELLYRIAEASFRAWVLVTAALAASATLWWVFRQNGEQQASLAFSVMLHAALLFMTYQLAEYGDPFVWPGPRSMTGTYLVARNEEQKQDDKKPAFKANDGDEAEKSPEPPKHTATKGDEGKAGGEGKVERARTPNPTTSKAPPRKGLFTAKNQSMLDNIINRQASMDYGNFMGVQGETIKRGDVGYGQGRGTGVGLGEGTGTTRGSNKGGPGGNGQSENDFVSGPGKVDAGKMRPGGGNCATPPCGVSPKLVAVAASEIGNESECLSQEQIGKVVRQRQGVFKACYQREINHTPNLAGKLVMHFQIGGDGAVKSSRAVSGSTLRNAAVEECVSRNIMNLKFPMGNCISNVNYPFIFSLSGG